MQASSRRMLRTPSTGAESVLHLLHLLLHEQQHKICSALYCLSFKSQVDSPPAVHLDATTQLLDNKKTLSAQYAK